MSTNDHKNVASAHLQNYLRKIYSNAPESHRFSNHVIATDMDWEPFESSEIFDGNETNARVVSFFGHFEMPEIHHNCLDLRLNQPIVAIDTNVFITSLRTVHQLLDSSIVTENPVLFVPCPVLDELDRLKSYRNGSSELSGKAQTAIKFINEKLSKNEMFGEQKNSANISDGDFSADDRIIQSCLKYKRKFRIILLTNDVNLQNKALINDIETFNDVSIFENLSPAKECEMNDTLTSSKHKPRTKESIKSNSKKPSATSSHNAYHAIITKIDKTLVSFLEKFIATTIVGSRRSSDVISKPMNIHQCYDCLSYLCDSVFRPYIDSTGHSLINQLIKLRTSIETFRRLTITDVRNYNEKCISLLNSFNTKENVDWISSLNSCKQKLQAYLKPAKA